MTSADRGLPTPDPDVRADAAPFWEATREHRLVLPRCNSCTTFIWYPRGFCPKCGSMDVDWVEVPGTGTVYSFSIPRRGQGAYRDSAPYVLAYVELDLPATEDGPRMITNIVGCDPADVRIGMPVTVEFHDTESGYCLTRFRPA